MDGSYGPFQGGGGDPLFPLDHTAAAGLPPAVRTDGGPLEEIKRGKVHEKGVGTGWVWVVGKGRRGRRKATVSL